MIVSKFGGSSLANAQQFKKVKAIINNDKDRRFIIPSAPGKRNSQDFKITDVLYLCHEHVIRRVDFNAVYGLIEKRFIDLRDELKLNLDIEQYLSYSKKGIATGASKDYCASRGEYLSGVLLAHYLNYTFIDPKEMIIMHTSGSIDEQTTYKNIEERLKNVKNAVIPGFYGMMTNGQIKTFSRGGSDISGAVIARGVNADLYENWTDVSGFLLADPRIVGVSVGISELSYKELRELSYMGANVFHEEAIFPVYKSGIPIQIKNTNSPNDAGTKIVQTRTRESLGSITGISGKKNFTVIAIEKTLMKKVPAFTLDVVSILEKYNVTFEHMPSGIDSLSIIISDEYLNGRLDLIIDEIKKVCQPDSVNILPNMALVAIVGEGMVQTKGIAKKIFAALSNANVNIRMINQGSNELSIIVGIENEDMQRGIKAVYEAFKNEEK